VADLVATVPPPAFHDDLAIPLAAASPEALGRPSRKQRPS